MQQTNYNQKPIQPFDGSISHKSSSNVNDKRSPSEKLVFILDIDEWFTTGHNHSIGQFSQKFYSFGDRFPIKSPFRMME
jgi:hypothetical protein